MASEAPVALDAMGGDVGVSPNVEGALGAVRRDGARVILVGDSAAIDSELKRLGGASSLREGILEIVHADEVVGMDEKPGVAARRKKGSSLRVACDLVEAGRACGAMSAGNSGAMLATGLLVFSRVDGVLRPAIATLLPTLSPIGLSLLVDAGANTECTAEHMTQWALLAATYVEHVHGMKAPPVGLLSNGEEDGKGTALTRRALELLRQTDLNFKGYVESRQLNRGDIVVFVTDGFTGNLVLKAAEGVFKFVKDRIRHAYQHGSVIEKLAGSLSRPVFARIAAELDPREFGAAPLLGLARPAFIAHGSSDAHAIRRGIAAVRAYAAHDVTSQMAETIKRHAHLWTPRAADAPNGLESAS
jgi:glycerol-3-phosphate acyltransferase PlsX